MRPAVLVGIATLAPTLAAQQPARPPVQVPAVEHRAEDVGTPDGMIRAFYDVISGPAGQPRQWRRDRTLYIPGVRFVALAPRPGGPPQVDVMDHQAFVDKTDAEFTGRGFFEREIHRVTRRWGNLAHVFSTYEWRRTPDATVGGRGVNSIELYHDGTRWWIAGAVWQDEGPGTPLPPDLLPDGGPSDSAAVAAVVAAYDRALETGDSAAALALLARDALVLESGDVETREQYRTQHLPADIAFARGVPANRSPVRVTVRGDAAWASSTSESRGEFRGRPVASAGAELMVLTREADGWKIRAIHWSSRRLTPGS